MFNNKIPLFNPDMYQGWSKSRQYFEGWYFKLVSADEQHAYAFIPGISMGPDGSKQAFIQVMDGKKCTAAYHHYPASQFQPSRESFAVSVGESQFSGSEINLQLPDIQGLIHFENLTPWPKMLGAPGIMGWYSFVPFMECKHGIVSLTHRLRGTLNINGAAIDFTGGKGYIEKDWGSSFPRAYVWMQSNHFETAPDASLIASVAHIPWLGSYFIGFISGFWFEKKLYKFATYTGAKKDVLISNTHLEFILKNSGSEIRIRASQAPGTALLSPLSGEMKGKINESLQAELQVEFLLKGRRVFEGIGRNAGLEVAGEVERLLD